MSMRTLLPLGCLLLAAPLAAQSANEPTLDRLRLPAEELTFIENLGQWPVAVRFLARLDGADLWVTDEGLVVDFYQYEAAPREALPPEFEAWDESRATRRRGHVVEARFEGGRAQRVEGRGRQSAYHNYFLGNDPARWASRVALYDEVVLHDVYDGISLRLYASGGRLHHDFTLAPGADLAAVQLRLEGTEGLDTRQALDRATVLRLPGPKTSGQTAPPPLGGSDLLYSTLLGGTNTDYGEAIAVGTDSSIYIAGDTFSSNFPTEGGLYEQRGLRDVFVARLRSENGGTSDLIYGTYLGGEDADFARAIALSANGSIYVTGETSSDDFSLRPAAALDAQLDGDTDAFVVRLNAAGSMLLYGTYLGGSEDDVGTGIAVGSDGTAYVSGETTSSNFPTPGGFSSTLRGSRDAFVARFNADGLGLQYGTYLGGDALDSAEGIALGADGSAYVTGRTLSPNFPTTPGAYDRTFAGSFDAFLARIDPAGASVLYGSFLGGNDFDIGLAVAVGPSGDAYVTGYTASVDLFPAGPGPPGDFDAFVVRIGPNNAGADDLRYGVYLGGRLADIGRSIAVSPNGDAYVTGDTESEDFPLTPQARDRFLGGEKDAFVTRLSADGGTLRYSTYLGGEAGDEQGNAIATDSAGHAYVTGETSSDDFPRSANPYDQILDGPIDAFVSKSRVNLTPELGDPIGPQELVLGEPPLVVDLDKVFSDPDGDALTFECSSSDENVASVNDCTIGTLRVTPQSTGEAVSTATITVTATDGVGSVSDGFVVTVVNPPPVLAGSIGPRTLALEGPPREIDLTVFFSDPNGDVMDFDAESADPSVVEVGVDGDTLTLTPKAIGIATVLVTADDGPNEPVSDAFTVTVESGNLPPTIDTPLRDDTLALGGSLLETDLRKVFSDPNQDPLAFTCSSSDSAVAPVEDECADGTLTVLPVAAGTATITATASDGALSITDTFEVLVVDPPPQLERPVSDITLLLGDDPFRVSLDTVFADPNGDAFDCDFEPSNPGIIFSSLDGCLLSIAPKQSGTTTVTLNASNEDGTAEDLFDVFVTNNPPPTVGNPIADTTLFLSAMDSLHVTLDTVFTDPNGDLLSFNCFSSNPDVARILREDCDDGLLTVIPLAEDSTTVEVTATDGASPEVATSFTITVIDDTNAPPVVESPITDTTLMLGAPPITFDLSSVFSDPDGDGLTFRCTSSDEGTVRLEDDCHDATLTFVPVAEGDATIVVTADDGPTTATNPFTVTVLPGLPPAVGSVTANPRTPQAGDAVTVSATAASANAVALRYRQGGALDFEFVAMSPTGGDGYQAEIPASSVTPNGVEFFVEATNVGGTAESPLQSLAVQVGGTGLAYTGTLPAGEAQTGYRMVSVPLDLGSKDAAAVLDELGEADDEAWRVFELLPPDVPGDLEAAGTDGQQYREGPGGIRLARGKAVWLIARDGGSFGTGPGTTTLTDAPFSMPLHQGWNLVGLPFTFSVPLDQVRLASGAPVQPQTYTGSWRNETAALEPFLGYAIRVEADTLLIAPSPDAARPTLAVTDEAEKADVPLWAVQIAATVGHARDDNNVALVAPAATDERDALDWYEPPPIGEYVSVAFAPAGGGAPLTVDARPVPEDGTAWPLVVRSNVRGEVALAFSGLAGIPAGFVVWLVDEAAGTVTDLRRGATYGFASQGDRSPVRLHLIVGTEAFAQATTGFDSAVPPEFSLAQNYPNPFQSVTSIQYGLPSDEHVTLDVFDVVGRRVAVLVDEVQEAGYHKAVWSRRGSPSGLASGVYVYRLRAGSFVATERMVVMR